MKTTDILEELLRDGYSIDEITEKAKKAKEKIDAEASKKAEEEKAKKVRKAKIDAARTSAINAIMLYVFSLDTKLSDKEKEELRNYLEDCLKDLETDLESLRKFHYSKDSKVTENGLRKVLSLFDTTDLWDY